MKHSPRSPVEKQHSSSISCSSHTQIETITTTSEVNGRKTVVKRTRRTNRKPDDNKDAAAKVSELAICDQPAIESTSTTTTTTREETETKTDNATREETTENKTTTTTTESTGQTSSEVTDKDNTDSSNNQTITTCAKIMEQAVVPPLSGDGSVTTSLEQTVSQQVSVTNGQQEVTSTAKSSQQAVVKHSKKSRGKKGGKGSTEETVVQHMSKAEGRQEIVTKSRMQGATASGVQSSVVQKTTDRSHEAKSSKSSEQTVVQRVGKNGRKQEMIITTTASSQESFYHVTTVKTVKKSSKSKVTKKR